MKLSGWGKYPLINSKIHTPTHENKIQKIFQFPEQRTRNMQIPRGLGRSYGDSALSSQVISSSKLNRFVHFDDSNGLLTCLAGVTLAEIIDVFVPRGWFLPVTPGTKFVTIGGAIASDVHGKNHHLDGCFSEHVRSLKISISENELLHCSKEENQEIFYATCGGMGLTGMILEATIQLIPIQGPMITEKTIKTQNLEETLELFDAHFGSTYSVAWIDCLSQGEQLGRSLLMLGEHSDKPFDKTINEKKKPSLSVPFDFPSFILNGSSVKAFNHFYYNRVQQKSIIQEVHFDKFFYPLDGIHNWNRIYGKNGFTQYQFVLPKEGGLEGMTKILRKISDSKRGSFLAVLKALGKQNCNYLSFPFEGYTLALDFKMDNTLLSFLDELDELVLAYNGRIYLAKDARMSEHMFKSTYPQWKKFEQVRQSTGASQHFNSLQSLRLGI